MQACLLLQVVQRLAAPEAVAGLVAEARAAAEVKDPDAGKEFGRGKRNRSAEPCCSCAVLPAERP